MRRAIFYAGVLGAALGFCAAPALAQEDDGFVSRETLETPEPEQPEPGQNQPAPLQIATAPAPPVEQPPPERAPGFDPASRAAQYEEEEEEEGDGEGEEAAEGASSEPAPSE